MLYSLGPLPLFFVALAALALGERALPQYARVPMAAVAAAALLLLSICALWRIYKHTGDRRTASGWAAQGYAVAVLGLAGYAAQLYLMHKSMGTATNLLQVLWPAVLLLGLLPACFIERTMGRMRHAPHLELGRVALAARAARLVWLGGISFAALNYTASIYNSKIDLSYFRTAHLGEASRNLARSIHQPVHVRLYFPPGNDVLEFVRGYAEDLARVSPQIDVAVVDQALDTERARQLEIRKNGYIVLQSGNRSEAIFVGTDIEEARHSLRRLDQEMQHRLLAVLRQPRIVYLTQGHAERDWISAPGEEAQGLLALKLLLEGQGYVLRRLGLAEGLASEVPQDAHVVAVLGPQHAFSESERASLERYTRQGGRLFVAIDPLGQNLDALLTPLNVRTGQSRVANSHYLVRLPNQSESPYNLVTTRIEEHAATTTLQRFAGRMGIVLPHASVVRTQAPATPEMRLSFLLHAMPDSFEDLNNNGRFDADNERKDTFALAAAVSRVVADGNAAQVSSRADATSEAIIENKPDEMRAIVVGNVEFVSSSILRNPGNQAFVLDAMRWLVGDDALAGATQNEEDTPLLHRKEADALWFYGVCFGAPLLVLACALFARRRGRAARHVRRDEAVLPDAQEHG